MNENAPQFQYTDEEWREAAPDRPLSDVELTQLLLLHRHWIWANSQREQFDAELREGRTPLEVDSPPEPGRCCGDRDVPLVRAPVVRDRGFPGPQDRSLEDDSRKTSSPCRTGYGDAGTPFSTSRTTATTTRACSSSWPTPLGGKAADVSRLDLRGCSSRSSRLGESRTNRESR